MRTSLFAVSLLALSASTVHAQKDVSTVKPAAGVMMERFTTF